MIKDPVRQQDGSILVPSSTTVGEDTYSRMVIVRYGDPGYAKWDEYLKKVEQPAPAVK